MFVTNYDSSFAILLETVLETLGYEPETALLYFSDLALVYVLLIAYM